MLSFRAVSIAETSAAPDVGAAPVGVPWRFAFVPSARPLVFGTLGGLAVVGAWFLWVWRTGRMGEIDAASISVLLGSVVAAVALVIGRLYHTARRTAATLGHVELDEGGVRWRWRDGSLGFDVPWAAVERAAFDHRNGIAVLYQREGGPILVGVLSDNGMPDGFVVPERFGELAALVKERVPEVAAGGAAAGALRLGLLTCAVAAGLGGTNQILGAWLGWRGQLLTAPALMGALGALIVIAAARIRAGRGPLVSPLYSPSYRARVLRTLVVVSAANFLLLALVNGLGR
jgi:hypothetical protein